jgi:hypothetical protein
VSDPEQTHWSTIALGVVTFAFLSMMVTALVVWLLATVLLAVLA